MVERKEQQNMLNDFTKQIALADRIVINKLDLVDESTIHELESSIR